MPLNPKIMVGGSEIKRAYQGTALLFDRTSPDVSIVTDIPEVDAVFVAEPAYLFTDAGVTNVTSSGDAVQEWHSTDGNVILSRVGSGVTYQESGGLAWVESDGNGRLEGPAPTLWVPPMMMATTSWTVGTTTYFYPLVIADPSEAFEANQIQMPPDESVAGLRTRDNDGNNETTFTIDDGKAYVVNALIDTNTSDVRINNSAREQITTRYQGNSNVVTVLGTGDATPSNNSGRNYGFVIAVGLPSAANCDLIDQWLASISGAALDGVTP